jgi:hypothetical protein
MQDERIGDQINQRVDIQQVGVSFINFYYTTCKTNINTLVTSGVLKNHTRLRYKNIEYKEQELVQLLTQINYDSNFILEETIIMDSGGRRADILVTGKIQMKRTHEILRFSQYFTIANNKDGNWFIHNMLLSVLS